jgi:ketosteroid isomerase-like protein
MKTKEQIKDAAQTTFRNHLEFLSSGQIEKWVDLFDENGILEFPYGPSDFPNLVKGKTELYEYMKNFPKHFLVTFENLHLQATERLLVQVNLTASSIFLWSLLMTTVKF